MKTKRSKLIIIGAGSLGVMTLDAALEMNCYEEILFIDDNKETNELIHGYRVIGGMEQLNEVNKETDYIIAIANNKIRKKIAEQYDLNYVNIIHPKAVLSRFIQLGIGNIILSHTTIDPNAQLSNHVIVNKNNSIGHDTILHNYSQVSPGSSFGGYVELGKGAFVGLGSAIIPNVKIEKWSVIGAGAVVTKDIPDNVTAVGVPAKIIKE